MTFVRTALNAQRKARGEAELTPGEFLKQVRAVAKKLAMPDDMLRRAFNVGFSGGEKKRMEMLQMAMFEPRVAILDETDSGLDIDALRTVSESINALRSPERAMLLITHYERLLEYVKPDRIHVLVDGRIVDSGGPELAKVLEADGYDRYMKAAA
jgi:Fe-S cluster assembly ATP-binding protein